MENKGGRPRKLTYEIRGTIIEGIEKGLTLKAACKCAGISYSSLANWKKLTKTDDHDAGLYSDLIVSVNTAKRFAQYQHRQQALASIQKEDFKFKQPPRIKLTKKERETQSINKVIDSFRERITALEVGRHKFSGGV